MSKKPTELEAAALTSSWSTAQQAALYHIHLAQQTERDEQEALKKQEKKEEKKMKEMARPEDVDGGEIVDGWVGPFPPSFLLSLFVLTIALSSQTTPVGLRSARWGLMRLCNGIDQRIMSAPIRFFGSPGPSAHTHLYLHRTPFCLLVSSHGSTSGNLLVISLQLTESSSCMQVRSPMVSSFPHTMDGDLLHSHVL